MAHYSDSPSSSEDLNGTINEALATGGPLSPLWHEKSEPDETTAGQPKDPIGITARAYQLEMVEASLRENVIVAMDTGSGKTQVAVLRIRAELDRMPSDKIIWFMAPTVSLCAQQLGVFRAQIPSVLPKIVTGADEVDSWSKSTWEGMLFNVKLVVTTPQVLLDALLHGFVQISSLALMIFDEAHNCTKKHPGSRVMREFYREAKNKGDQVPHILGLTASPVVKADVSSLEELETTLDATCRSPTRHREELLAHTRRPSMFSIDYTPKLRVLMSEYTQSMTRIHEAYTSLNIMDDPYVHHLSAQNTDRSKRALEDAFMRKETYVQRIMKKLCRRSVEIFRDMGSWAADLYIFEAISRFLDGVRRQGPISKGFRDAEAVYLARIFQNAKIERPSGTYDESVLSEKVRKVIDLLTRYEGNARGIVFVKERATTVILARVLKSHPELSKRYRIGKMVGTSFVPGVKQDFFDLPGKGNSLSLESFRDGRLNLLVATSVLEEGIDVPACNLVVCMDKPANLKSFIQRRGRARMGESHLYLFEETTDTGLKREWELLETQMKKWYEDDLRELQNLRELEDDEALDYPELRVESTTARLTIHDAKSHLNHFCATLSSRKYVDFSPDYIIEKVVDEHARAGTPNLVKATVLLPVSLPPEIRRATSSRAWLSEQNACKDAAFQAYQALYRAKLIDDHLLPPKDKDFGIELPGRPGLIEARAQFVPWLQVAQAWKDNAAINRRALRLLDQNHSIKCELELVLPVSLPHTMPAVDIYLNHQSHLILDIGEAVPVSNAGNAVDVTSTLLSAAYGHRRLDIRNGDFAVRVISRSGELTRELSSTPLGPDSTGRLLRDAYGSPFIFKSVLPSKPPVESLQKVYKGFEEDPEEDPDIQYVTVSKYPRGPGLFHRPPPPQQKPSMKPSSRVLPMNGITVDDISMEYMELGLLIPSLLHYIEVYLVASELSNTLLAPLNLADITMVVTAICASSARTPTNYERYEFLGDSVLKLCATLNVAATNLRMPEGLLSRLKDRIVSNSRLCRAAQESGLDQFIISKQFALKGTSERWRPPYISDLIKGPADGGRKRVMATKTLADVVEAVIGVSYIDGGLDKARQCMNFFLSEGQFKDIQTTRDVLFEAVEPKYAPLPAIYTPLEELIGYVFQEKALLVEAMTHPSYVTALYTYERLEFVGDSILDHIIVGELFAEAPRALENWEMHLLRTALVNGDILAFLMMEWGPKLPTNDIIIDNGEENGSRKHSPRLRTVETTTPLWNYMRSQSVELVAEQEATRRRHAELRESILDALNSGTRYPWAQLARLHAPKFFSDLYEALIGAIWVDSGSFDACKGFIERSGLLAYLRRLRAKPTEHVWHPKEELGRLAVSEKLRYELREAEGEGVESEMFGCKVFVGEVEIADVSGALFKEEARVKAATEAVAQLKR